MKNFIFGLLMAVGTLLLLAESGTAAEIGSIRVSDQGQVYGIPLEGWDFKRHCGTGWCSIKDVDTLAGLSQVRDAYKQTLAPNLYPHQDLSRVLGKLMTASQRKQALNQFDQALTNVAGSYIGTALRTAAGDPTAAISVVTGAIATTAAAGSSMGTVEALGLGLYFGQVAEISARQAADFQNRYFAQTPVGWNQIKPIPLSALKTAAGSAHEALRLSGPAAVLMTKVTYRDGWDTLNSFLRNTYYAVAGGIYGDIFSTLDSLASTGKGGLLSDQALKVFDRAINTGRGNPFDTDIAIYREQVVKHGGFREEPSKSVKGSTPDTSKDQLTGAKVNKPDVKVRIEIIHKCNATNGKIMALGKRNGKYVFSLTEKMEGILRVRTIENGALEDWSDFAPIFTECRQDSIGIGFKDGDIFEGFFVMDSMGNVEYFE